MKSPSELSTHEGEALDWLIRRGDGSDLKLEAAFRAWLDISPEHRRAYAHWEQDWRLLDIIDRDELKAWRQPSSSQGWSARARDRIREYWEGAPARALAWLGALGLVAGLGLLVSLGSRL